VLTAVLRRSEVLGEFTLGADRHGAPVEMGAVLDGMVRWWDARTMQTRLDCAMAQRNGDAGAEHCAAAAPGAFPYAFCYTVDDGRDQPRAKVSFHPIIDCHCFGLYAAILLPPLSFPVKMTVSPRAAVRLEFSGPVSHKVLAFSISKLSERGPNSWKTPHAPQVGRDGGLDLGRRLPADGRRDEVRRRAGRRSRGRCCHLIQTPLTPLHSTSVSPYKI
jgi:hypothetical protein